MRSMLLPATRDAPSSPASRKKPKIVGKILTSDPFSLIIMGQLMGSGWRETRPGQVVPLSGKHGSHRWKSHPAVKSRQSAL
jgi:hypothetical protein